MVYRGYTLVNIFLCSYWALCYSSSMAKGKPIPVKLAPEMIARLDAASQKMGLNNRSAVIKFCLQTFLTHFEKTGESKLPPDWREILHETDGRAHRYSKKEKED